MLLLIPGPVQTRPEVRACMAEDIAPWDEEFRDEYAAMRPRIVKIAGGVEGKHVSLPLPGCGHMIIEAAIRTFVPAGAKLLVVRNGGYADRLARLAESAGRVVVALDGPDDAPMPAERLAQALAENPDCGQVALVVSETGTGIVNDPNILGPVIAAAGRRMICDAVSGFGALPFSLEAHPECDVVVFTSNKCLEGLPGFGFAVAPIARLEACRGQAGSWVMDLSDVYDHALKNGWGSFRFTPAVQALRAFGKAMEIYEAEGGQPARLARYSRNRDVMYAGLKALGFTPYVAPEHQGPIIVNVYQPVDPNWSLEAFQRGMKARGVILSDFSSTLKPSMRFGCIGAIGEEDIRFALKQAEAVLQEMGVGTRAAA
ncbi:2-aminoethylphosphonate--pyruvate transaminase [Falsiroseomonas sp.]|uniref:2-aminoethylphosphonate--pyruvate transaminase n=1 Tax=Falsiroseomonas sp. TaxID=2870721 RepID=UPI00273771CA|nr:2-aminoethylphosphonate--pyruvate transaminase [Falsiroseomonas sp.]MDP3418387.1 2-aminoethylphosphonate--pyruvate transaminase [Falsiroseomonas sp.]